MIERKIKVNSIAIMHPLLAKEWHETLNGDKKPEYYTSGSRELIFWKCSICGEIYPSRIFIRTRNKNHYKGCKVCKGVPVIVGENDVLSLHPNLESEFCQEKNGEKTLSQYAVSHTKKLWWKCPKCGYEYEEWISIKVGGKWKKGGCPHCSPQQNRRERETLSHAYPLIASQIHPEDNPGVCVEALTKGSHTVVKLRCAVCGNIREQGVHDLVRYFCSGCGKDKATAGIDDISTTHPCIAADWVDMMNRPHTPRRHKATSMQPVFWKCQICGHIFLKSIFERVRDPLCPKCNKF